VQDLIMRTLVNQEQMYKAMVDLSHKIHEDRRTLKDYVNTQNKLFHDLGVELPDPWVPQSKGQV
jgi:hypothetical protein